MNYINKDREIRIIWGAYHNELVKLRGLIDFQNENDWNRMFIRTFVSMVEGIGYRTRQNLIDEFNKNKIHLSAEEIIVLKEESIDLAQDGSLKPKKRMFPFESIFRFTFEIYSTHHNKHDIYSHELSKDGFQKLKQTIDIRNRITHPKRGEDISVNGKEVKIADDCSAWFHQFLLKMFKGDILEENI